MKYEQKIQLVPIWQKSLLSLEEAVAYSGLGRHSLIRLSDDPECKFIIWSGRKRLFKRVQLDEFIASAYSV